MAVAAVAWFVTPGCQKNQAPSVPNIVCDTATYTMVPFFLGLMSTDPAGVDVAYLIDWGDEVAEPTAWTGYKSSGLWIETTHVYSGPGEYQLRVRARNSDEKVSAWTEVVYVNVTLFPAGPPGQFSLMAHTDSTVRLSWQVPSEGNPARYVVFFRGVNEPGFDTALVTRATLVEHFPEGRTGWYKVAAQFGQQLYECPTVLSTVPVRGYLMELKELNASPAMSGYGWDRPTGAAGTFSMANASSAGSVDWYVTDFLPGFGHPPFSVASPDMSANDSGAHGVVPAAEWRSNGLTNPLADEQTPLPAYAQGNYFTYTEITSLPTCIGCCTAGEAEKHYALIKVSEVEPDSGIVRVDSWFQLVPNLRLIQHDTLSRD